MNAASVALLAQVLAVQAEIEGMKAVNAIAAIHGQLPLHANGDFDDKAEQLRSLAYAADNQHQCDLNRG